ncbi:hypothetical protein [Methylomagnum ishizawai]|uniref:hypothetical protein n=1 Tax=Methylomagnum ishizawai TaxID=1760988 RepID=UPI001C33EA1F|nr:hypothetical protein [Methylomagnum ishizawai]BBL77541.1 hypothetical protein MishRS11D_46390 [Methylomagnum ishizawai]
MAGGVVAVAGSRALPPAGLALVQRVARALVASGRSLAVGCASGADAAVLGAVPASAVSVFAAFGPGGVGSCPVSAVSAVAAVAAAGGSVVWWAGGPASVPLAARLAARSAAVVGAASSGCVVFFGSPCSRGSLLAASLAAGRSLPVVAFPVGFPGSALPSLGAGSWVPCSRGGVWASAWSWVPAQAGLF